MKELQRYAVLAAFLDKLQQAGVWCNELRVQKSAYLLQALLGVPLQFPFIFYKHGPFCFELMDELTAMQAYGLLGVEVKPYPLGPAFVVTPLGRQYPERYPVTLGQYDEELTLAVQKFGGIRPTELERIAGAFYLSLNRNGDVAERARRLHERTPHVPLLEARAAVAQLDQIMQETCALAKV